MNPTRYKKSQPDYSNISFENSLVGLHCLQPIWKYRKAENPTATMIDVSANQMFPLSLLGVRPIKREASSFSKYIDLWPYTKHLIPSTTPSQREKCWWSPMSIRLWASWPY